MVIRERKNAISLQNQVGEFSGTGLFVANGCIEGPKCDKNPEICGCVERGVLPHARTIYK